MAGTLLVGIFPLQASQLVNYLVFGEINFGNNYQWHALSVGGILALGVGAYWKHRSVVYVGLIMLFQVILHEGSWVLSAIPYYQSLGAPAYSYAPGTLLWTGIGVVAFCYLFVVVLRSAKWDYRRIFYAWLPYGLLLLAWHLAPGGFHFSIPTIPNWPYNHDFNTNLWETGTWVVSNISVAYQMLRDPAKHVPFSRFQNRVTT